MIIISYSKRPQDKWNDKVGYKSKSFKLYEHTANEFNIACAENRISQSKKLTEMMNAFIIETARRNKAMVVKQYLEPNSEYEGLVQATLDKTVFNYTKETIKKQKEDLMFNKRNGDIITNEIPYVMTFNEFGPKEPLMSYLLSEKNEMVEFVCSLFARQVAIQELITEQKIMPSTPHQTHKIQLNIYHDHGNSIFDLYMELLPFSTFVVINSN